MVSITSTSTTTGTAHLNAYQFHKSDTQTRAKDPNSSWRQCVLTHQDRTLTRGNQSVPILKNLGLDGEPWLTSGPTALRQKARWYLLHTQFVYTPFCLPSVSPSLTH